MIECTKEEAKMTKKQLFTCEAKLLQSCCDKERGKVLLGESKKN